MSATLERDLCARIVELSDDNARLRAERDAARAEGTTQAVHLTAIRRALDPDAPAGIVDGAAVVASVKRLVEEEMREGAVAAEVSLACGLLHIGSADELAEHVRGVERERDNLRAADDEIRARLVAYEALAAAVRAVVREHGTSGRVATAADLAMVAALGDVDLGAPEAWPATGITHAGRWWHRADGAWEHVGPSLHGVEIRTPADARRAMGTP